MKKRLIRLPKGQMCDGKFTAYDADGNPLLMSCPNPATKAVRMRLLPWPAYVCDTCEPHMREQGQII